MWLSLFESLSCKGKDWMKEIRDQGVSSVVKDSRQMDL
jgi:hypothetical protein